MSLHGFAPEPEHIGQLRQQLQRFVAQMAPRAARLTWDK
ncbi:MAG: hypothetical protein RL186_1241, partial [Pseudomonadota bacterium]